MGGSYENNIFQNKYLSKLCFVPGYSDQEITEPGALSIELDGTFHRIKNERYLEKEDRPDKQLSGQHQIRDGEMQVYFGKKAFDSLLQSMFAGNGHLNLMNDSIKMSVAKLDDMAYGYENAFKETSLVNITAQVDYIHSVTFDQQFNNIPLKADVSVFFDNPIKPLLRSAQA